MLGITEHTSCAATPYSDLCVQIGEGLYDNNGPEETGLGCAGGFWKMKAQAGLRMLAATRYLYSLDAEWLDYLRGVHPALGSGREYIGWDGGWAGQLNENGGTSDGVSSVVLSADHGVEAVLILNTRSWSPNDRAHEVLARAYDAVVGFGM